MDKLNEVATADLSNCDSVASMARSENWTAETYALALAEHIRDSRVPLDRQRERLQALAQMGGGLGGLQGDQAAADTLSLHAILLESLWHRFARLAHETADGTKNGSTVSERYLNAALRAQKGTMACLSALKAIRDGNQAPPTTAAPVAVVAPATVQTLEAK